MRFLSHIAVFLAVFQQASMSAFAAGQGDENLLAALDSPVLLRGDDNTAYRDVAALYHDGEFHLFATLIRTESDKGIYSYVAQTTSPDLKSWSEPEIVTPRGMHLNYSSPGNVVCVGGRWVMCLQTYPRLDYYRGQELRWADQTARVFLMHSPDLQTWGEPELMYVKGPDVSREAMGRMIDPYLIEDRAKPGRWWCFFKQNGVSMSYSDDGLTTWTYAGSTASGENVCVLHDGKQYILLHSPRNGMKIKRSADLKDWRDWGNHITLGQDRWPWAETRLTAGAILDLRADSRFGKYVMFFHGSGPGKQRTQDNCDSNSSIGIAWSDDLLSWDWPGKADGK